MTIFMLASQDYTNSIANTWRTILLGAMIVVGAASAQTAQTITGFNPPATKVYALSATIALTATGGGSGNPVVFASTTPTTCTVASTTASVVSVGTCTLTADQAGNATYSAAPQVTKSVNITKGSQTITFITPSSPAINGAAVTMSAAASSGLTVAFATTTATICSVSGSTLTPVLAGTCTVTADQAGNTNFNAAPQVTRSVTVQKIGQTITFATIPAKTVLSPPFSVSGTATSGLPVSISTTSPSSVCTVSNGTVTTVGVGSCSVVASQSGDATYAAAPSIARSFNITLAPQTITFATLPAKLVTDPPVALAATATSGLPVSFSSTTTGACTVAGTTLTLVAAGTCTVSATQAGNALYASAPALNRSVTITNPTQVITFKTIPPRSVNFGPFAITATSSAGFPVVFTSNTPLVCSVSNGTVSLQSVGTCSITANQPGTSIVQPAPPVTRTFLVGLEKQLIIFANIAPQTLATSTLNIAATSTSGLAVSFATQTPAICSLGGTNVTLLAAGICTIAATQGGNSIYAAAPVDTNSFRISKLTQTITFTSPPTTTLATSSINLVGSATSSFPVSFTASPATICTVSGTVLSLVAAGRCSVTAAQVGDAKWNPAANVTRVFTVAKIAQTISFNALSTTPLAAGTVALSASTSSGLTVTFTSRTPTVCTVIGNRVTLIKTGACTIAANQAGDATYLAAPQSVRSFTVSSAGLIAQTISGFVPPASVAYAPGLIITLSATGGASSNPVTFGSNSTSVCTVSGATVTVLSYGSCVVTADQTGSTGYSAAAQVNVTINVTAAAQTITFGPIPSKVSSDLPFPVSATASSGLGVVVTSNTLSVCTVQNSTVTLIRDGQCTLAADQIGNDNYQPAATVLQSFSVAPGAAAQRIVSVAVGYAHACALTDAGGIKCWGFNGYGALGDGTTTDRAAPVDVIGLGGTATAVAAGWYRTCALLSNGDIKCWGSNSTGALGDGTTTDSASPVQVVTGGLAATKIVVGGIHSCAIFVNGEARCWGSNLFGQLGDATGSNSALPVTVVELGGAVTAIQAGFYNSCAQAAGTWKCWGFNIRSYQPLGASQFEVLYLPESRPQWGFNPTAVALGQIHSCGLTSGNGAKCWGYAAYGQLGDGVSTPVQPIPVDVSGLMSGTSAISAAAYSTCALTSAGAVKCWGANFGPTPTDVIGATSGMVAVGVGSGFSCGVTYRGGVRCWGVANQFGQIGRSFSGIRADADYVTGLYDGVAFNQSILFPNPGPRVFGDAPFAISATASSGLSVSFRSATPSVCTVANGIVTLLDGGVCTIVASQSGGPTTVAAPEVSQSFLVTNNPQPQAITNFAPPSSIDSSQKYLILSATGGASGNPVVFATSTPNVCRVGAGFVTILDAGNCIVTAYQLGNAFFSAAVPITATIVVVAPATLVPQTLTKLTPGSPLTFYGSTQVQLNIQSDGSVNPIAAASTTPAICTVSNNLYLNVLALGTCQITATQAGNGIYAPGQVIFAIDVVLYVPPPPSIVGAALGVGAGHACAVSATGSLRCWGSNASGQLGDATTSNRSTPVDVIGITTGVVAVAGGGFHTCLLTSAGGVRCWGANDRGQLGNGNNTPSLSPVNVQGLSTGVLDIALGNAHSCAFMQGGSIKCWGAGTNGAVGDGAGLDRNAPVDVPLAGSGNVDLRAGGQHTCVVTAGGTVKCWGDNSAGQLGDGTTAAVQLSPVTATGLSGAALGVEVGGLHTCALLADGSVQCWGANTSGQLGTGDNTAQPLPTGVVGLSAGTTSIALGTATSCAIVNAGGVKCWGNINNATLASDVDGLDTLTAELGVGGAFACALNANGLVRCWGDNTFGQLGDGTNTAKQYAGAVLGFVAGGAPTKLSQTISFTAIPSTPLSQISVNLVATASSGLPVFISSLDTSVCTVNGTVATLVAAGNCQLVANQSGNISFFAAPQVSQSFQVTSGTGGQTAQTITGFTLPSTLNVGSTTALSAAGGASGNPILFSSLTPSTCSVSGGVLTGGTATGTCTVAANQAGSASYHAAAQVTASTNVVLIPQTITGFTPTSPIPFVANSTVTLSATGGGSGNPVVFASTTPTVCTVTGTTATILSAGSCVVTANQAGNTTYAAVTQVTATIAVGLSAQSINFASIVDIALSATPPPLTATATSGLPVAFTSSTPTVCTVSGATLTLLSLGACVIAADQPGNASFSPAAQVQRSFSVLTGAQTISFDPLPDRVYGDAPFALVASASPGLPVTFSSSSSACALSSGSVQILSVGSCTITATQPGNASYAAAAPVARTFVIAKQNQVITISAIADQTFGGQPLSVTATSTSGQVVSFSTSTPLVCTNGGVNGSQILIVGAGSCTIAADQAGNSNINAAPQASLTFNVGKASQSISFAALADRGVSDGSFTLTASVTSGLAVAFSSQTTGVCTVSGNTVSVLSMGTCSIAADQAGNSNYLAASQVVRAFNVKAAQTINGFVTPASYVIGSPPNVVLTATATSGLGVRFESFSTDVCVVNGANVTFVGSGICDLAAQQDGSATYSPAPQARASIIVLPPGQTPSAPTILSGAPVPAVKTEPYSKRVLLASNSPISSLSVIGLPPGIDSVWNNKNNIDLSGTPLVSGMYSATIVATNASGTANLNLAITVLDPLLSATSISNGGGFYTPVSCAVYAGGVACWGGGLRGVPADPNATYVPVFAVPPGSNATAVSVGVQHVCAVVSGGLQCWGAYSYQWQGGPLTSVTPASVFPAGSGVTAVAAGGEHTCAVVGGGVQCFGSNRYSQLGNGDNVSQSSIAPSVAIPVGSGVTAIASGTYHSCAVVNGAVNCWGNNANIALGVASLPPSTRPNTSAVPIETLPSGSFTTAVSAAGNRTCALTNGGLTCWGDGSLPSAIIAQGGGVSAISGTCAVVNGGLTCFDTATQEVYPANSGVTETSGVCAAVANRIRCRGIGSVGLASGNASTVTQPDPSVTIPSGSGATAIAVGPKHACAVIGGGVKCWGSNTSNQLGVNTPADSIDPVTTLAAGSGATSVAAGGSGSCALVDGGVKCWGGSVFVDAGNSTYAVATTPATIIAGRSGASQVATGIDQSCAIVSGGIKCWSAFNVGGTSPSTPTDVLPAGSGAIALAVSAGGGHACAVVNGGVKCWGSNSYGQLGNGGASASTSPVDAIAPNSGATAVATGYLHSCAIVNTGVMCWGWNDYGQLGNNSTIGSTVPVSILPALSGATDITAATASSCVVLAGGVKCWGSTVDGTLGTVASGANTKLPLQTIAAGSDVISIASGSTTNFVSGQVCALADGGVFCWGVGYSEAVGNRDLYKLTTAVPAPNASVARAPTITFADSDAGSLLLSFTPPTYNGGSGITGYAASCRSLGNVVGTGTAGATATNIRVTGLANLTNYQCSMRAINAIGSGEESNVVVGTPAPRYPSRPIITSVTPISGAVVLQFTPPAFAGSSPIVSYQGYCQASGNPAASVLVLGTATSVRIGDLNPGVTYSCTVSASNVYGSSPNSVSLPASVTLAAPVATTVAISSPANNATFATPAAVTISASASTGAGILISRIDFFVDSVLVGSANAAPYSVSWTAVTGSHSITAVAYDSVSGVTTSPPVSVSVTSAIVPTIAITAPTTGSSVTLPAPTPVAFVTTVPNGKTIDRIEFATQLSGQSNVVWRGAATGNSTVFDWKPLAAGTYTLIATVLDNEGNAGVSAPVTITITGAAGETISFMHNDLGGNTIMASDGQGATLWKENYTPFGDRVVKSTAAISNRLWFAGKAQDSETGLSYFGARYYDPAIGRFMGIDAAPFSETNLHSFNRYAYGNNNPHRFIDPDGNSALSVLDWKDFAKDVGGLYVNHIIFAVAKINGNEAVAQMAVEGMRAGVVDAAISTAGVINPAPGTGSMIRTAIKSEVKAVETAAKSEITASKTIGRGGENEATKRGREAHANYENTLGGGYEFNKALPSGKRPDAIDFENKVVRELKPNNPRAIKRGEKQVEGYKKELEAVTGEKWTSHVDTYNK